MLPMQSRPEGRRPWHTPPDLSIDLPTILQRCGTYLHSPDDEANLRRARKFVDSVTYIARSIEANGHLLSGGGEMLGNVETRLSLTVDAGSDAEFCTEVGTIPIAPRPLPMWVGSFRLY